MKQLQKRVAKAKQNQQMLESSFKTRMSSQFNEKKIFYDISKCMRVCRQLDLAQGICQSKFWEEEKQKKKGIDAGSDSGDENEQKTTNTEHEQFLQLGVS